MKTDVCICYEQNKAKSSGTGSFSSSTLIGKRLNMDQVLKDIGTVQLRKIARYFSCLSVLMLFWNGKWPQKNSVVSGNMHVKNRVGRFFFHRKVRRKACF